MNIAKPGDYYDYDAASIHSPTLKHRHPNELVNTSPEPNSTSPNYFHTLDGFLQEKCCDGDIGSAGKKKISLRKLHGGLPEWRLLHIATSPDYLTPKDIGRLSCLDVYHEVIAHHMDLLDRSGPRTFAVTAALPLGSPQARYSSLRQARTHPRPFYPRRNTTIFDASFRDVRLYPMEWFHLLCNVYIESYSNNFSIHLVSKPTVVHIIHFRRFICSVCVYVLIGCVSPVE